MEEAERGRKKVLQTAISALCLEAGFISVEKRALDALGQLVECYMEYVGKKAKDYCEIALRTSPTLSDVELALVDVGADINSLPEHAKRQQRRHLPKQVRSYPAPQRRVLQVGSKRPRPPHINPYLPAFPDPHTYIRTPTFSTPASDYKKVREKLATQKRNSRKGLSKLLSKTRPSRPVAGDMDRYGLYTVVSCTPQPSPLYLQALKPTPDDQVDTVAAEKSNNPKSPSPTTAQSNVTSNPEDNALKEEEKGLPSSQELYENPFMKPPKRIRLKPL